MLLPRSCNDQLKIYISSHRLNLSALPSNIIFLHFPCTVFTLFSFHTLFSVFVWCLSLCSLSLYFHLFSDMPQPTPPFLLFLPAIHLPLLSSLIILSHLLLEPGSVNEGENPALALCSTHAMSHAVSFFYVHSEIVLNLLLTLFSML